MGLVSSHERLPYPATSMPALDSRRQACDGGTRWPDYATLRSVHAEEPRAAVRWRRLPPRRDRELAMPGETLLGACLLLLPPLLGVLAAAARWMRTTPEIAVCLALSLAFFVVVGYLALGGLPPYTRWPGVLLFFLVPASTIWATLRSPIGSWGRIALLVAVPLAGYVGFGAALSIGAWLRWLMPAY